MLEHRSTDKPNTARSGSISTPATSTLPAARTRALGHSWLALCLAVAIHVADEAATGFLGLWNSTVMAVHERLPWLPQPAFSFHVWLTGLVTAVVLLAALTPVFLRGGGRLRPLAWFLAVVMIGNGLGHIAATILGHTVAGVQVPRPAPGFYSSPVLIAAAIILLVELRATRGRSSATN